MNVAYYILFRAFGVHPHFPFGMLRFSFNLAIVFFVLLLVALNVYLTGEVEGVEVITTFIMVCIKYVSLVAKKEAIRNSLDMMNKFWKVDLTDSRITFLIQYTTKTTKYCLLYACIGILSYMLKSLVIKNTRSILNSYIPPQMPYFLLYATERYAVTFLGLTYFAYNAFVCNLIIMGAVQFRLLNLKIAALLNADENNYSVDQCITEAKQMIKYHVFLLRYVQELNKILSTPSAVTIVISVSLICVNMYTLSSKDASEIDLWRAAIITMALLTEYLLLFGLPAQLLMDENADTADMVYYDVSWYLRNAVPLRKYLSMIILRSQIGICIRAGDYHVINNETVVMMVKTAYSFYAFLQTLS